MTCCYDEQLWEQIESIAKNVNRKVKFNNFDDGCKIANQSEQNGVEFNRKKKFFDVGHESNVDRAKSSKLIEIEVGRGFPINKTIVQEIFSWLFSISIFANTILDNIKFE